MTHLVTIPAPGLFLSTNQRMHFHKRADLTATWREAAAWEAKRQHLPAFGLGPVHVTATFHRADQRAFDLDGASPTVKACIDGLRDAGCLTEDDTRVIPRLTLAAGEPWADAALVLTIEKIGSKA